MFLIHPATIWLILLAFWIVVICCNFYVGYVQLHLFQKGLLHAHWRVGSSILKSALLETTDKRDVRMIRRASVAFNVSIVLFTGFILGIVWMAV